MTSSPGYSSTRIGTPDALGAISQRRPAAAVLLALTAVWLPSLSHAAVTHVFPGAALCNTTLQACVDASASGDTILLDVDGLNPEKIFVTDKSLTISQLSGNKISGLTQLTVTADQVPVSFVANGIFIRALSAVCVHADLDLQARFVNFGSGGVAIGENGSDACARKARLERNRFDMSGDFPKDAITIASQHSPVTAEIVGNTIDYSDAFPAQPISRTALFAFLSTTSGSINNLTINRNRIKGFFDSGIEVIASRGTSGDPVRLSAVVTNNVISGGSDRGLDSSGVRVTSAAHSSVDATIVNNTIADGSDGIRANDVRADSGGTARIALNNNLVAFNRGVGLLVDQASNVSASNNLAFANAGGNGDALPGEIVADPRLVDRAASNYALGAGSPAINAGLDDALPQGFTEDIDANPRRNGIIDIGAFESTATIASHLVAATAGLHGTITPSTAQVADGARAVFSVLVDDGFEASVGGTCGGTQVGTTFTTVPIFADCTVVASFAAISRSPTSTTLTLVPNPAEVSQPITATVSVATADNSIATGMVTVSSAGASCVAPLSHGEGTCSLTFAASGNVAVTARFAGDAENAPSAASVDLVVGSPVASVAATPAPLLSIAMLGVLAILLLAAAACERW